MRRDHRRYGRPLRRDGQPPTTSELREAYGIEARELRRHPHGFESECWIADDTWFVKVWRHEAPANLTLLEQLDLPVPVPLRAGDGEVITYSQGRPFAVFPYIRGRPATWSDWGELANAMRRIHETPTAGLDLREAELDTSGIRSLRARVDHPWIRDRRHEVTQMLDRLEAVVSRAQGIDVPKVLCHSDLIGDNVLIGDDGHVVAVLDWDWAMLAPREHDLWIATEGAHAAEFLRAYGQVDVDPTHLEYALLRRAVGDLAARVEEETDRAGIETWGFERWRRLDSNLALLMDEF